MEKLKLKSRVLVTYEEVEKGALLYFEHSVKQNPFLMALGIGFRDIYEQTFKPKIQTIVDQQLSIGLFEEETGKLIGAGLAIDLTTHFDFEIKNKILKAQEEFFNEGKKRILQEFMGNLQPGLIVDWMIGVIRPEYMKANYSKIMTGFLVQHHIRKGYMYQYGECCVPTSQYFYETMDVPYLSLRMFYKDYEFEGERVFENLDFGKEYKHNRPGALFFIIKYDNMIEAGVRLVNKKVEARPSL